ncbi:hypothetical protein C2G38_2285454 [Gigaspora rosea]|uniref:Ubiquitin-like domain-containing protein n=1 Tax=Gigaspora rosea TaxID=44941 RepID=A0A397U5L5_9GLOM|nr:hypothetical protein C2G38_2285454 [Gigaspora rosea]
MSALPLIAAALSYIIDYPVKTYDECIAEGLDPNNILDIELIHKYSLAESNDNGEFVQRPIFKKYEENKIQSMLGIDIKKISLSFSSKPLEDHQTLEFYNIKQNDTIHVSRKNNVGNVEPAEHDFENDEPTKHDEKIDDIQIPMKPIRIFAYYHRIYSLNVTTNDTVLEKLRSMLGIDIKKITLSFSGKPLEDHRTLEYYKIKQNDTIHVSRRIIGGAFDYFVLTNDYLDPRYDNDFSNQRDGPTLKRGNEPYKPPYGWNRIAINIKRYGDNKWLGTDNNSWPVSFHGISKDAAENGLIFQKENALRMEKESIQHLM